MIWLNNQSGVASPHIITGVRSREGWRQWRLQHVLLVRWGGRVVGWWDILYVGKQKHTADTTLCTHMHARTHARAHTHCFVYILGSVDVKTLTFCICICSSGTQNMLTSSFLERYGSMRRHLHLQGLNTWRTACCCGRLCEIQNWSGTLESF